MTTRNDSGAEQTPSPDLAEINRVVDAMYEVISFPQGGEPDWDGLRRLFAEDARLVPPEGRAAEGVTVLDVEGFIEWGKRAMEPGSPIANGFYENDVNRVTEVFGNIAHVFSTYESRFTRDDPEPAERGINSIQLLKKSGRWQVLTVLWDVESGGKPIPEKYLAPAADSK